LVLATETTRGDTGAAGAPKIRLENVSKSFATETGRINALEDITLEIGDGEPVCVVGPSGCGKSTLLNLIAGLASPDRGEAFHNEQPITGPSPRRILLFQEHALFPWFNVIKNVEFGLEAAGVSKDERRERALKYLRMVQLSRFKDSYVHELSGGMKQRVALARALVLDPEVLLLDEPFASLDALTRNFLLWEIQDIWMKTRKTMVFVTHNVPEAICLGNRVVVLSARPARIKEIFTIDLPRPRSMNSMELLEHVAPIMEVLRGEVDKVVRDETDAREETEDV
jgi:NitT/TauT family transport system ATP-binding protein